MTAYITSFTLNSECENVTAIECSATFDTSPDRDAVLISAFVGNLQVDYATAMRIFGAENMANLTEIGTKAAKIKAARKPFPWRGEAWAQETGRAGQRQQNTDVGEQ